MSFQIPKFEEWSQILDGLKRVFQALLDWDKTTTPRRQAAHLASLVAMFFLLAALSLFNATMATVTCATLLGATALLLPRLGVMLVVVVVPIQGVFELPREQMQIVLAVGLLSISARHVHLVRRLMSHKMPAVIVALAVFVVVFAARALFQTTDLPTDRMIDVLKEGVFYASLVVLALTTYCYGNDPRFRTGLIQSVVLATALMIVVDGTVTYFAGLNEALKLSNSTPDSRLAGLHVNPNATAKFLLLGLFLACCAFWTAIPPTVRVASIIGFIIVALALNATVSKSALVGMFGAFSLYLLYSAGRRSWRPARSMAATLLFLLAISAIWNLVPLSAFDGLGDWFTENSEKTTEVARPAPATRDQSMMSRIENEYRLRQSYSMRVERPVPGRANSEMYRNIPGSITYTKRDCDWTCAGQRDRLWKSGLAIVQDHWLLGIGAAQWPYHFQERLGFPFDSPHNAILELWGGYGLAGLAVYLFLVWQVLQLIGRSFQSSQPNADSVYFVATSLYLLAILLTELFDPAKYFALSPHAVWLWAFIGPLTRGVEDQKSAGSSL